MTHGTLTGYTTHACRCEECTAAMRHYQRERRIGVAGVPIPIDREALAKLLDELFPYGLTEDCPARRELRARARSAA